jgi:electron transfer flavoprotein alpha subunit
MVCLERFGEDTDALNRGLLSEGRRIAGLLGRKLSAVSVGAALQDSRMLQKNGVSAFFQLEGRGFEHADADAYAWALRRFVQDFPFRALLFADYRMGAQVAPRLAHALGTAAATACTDIRVREQALYYVRSLYNGQFEQEVSFASGVREIATLRPEALTAREAARPALPKISRIPIEMPPDLSRTRAVESIPPDFKTVDVANAERIVGAGLGSADPGLMQLVQELADLLKGSVAATRPVVDEGHLPKPRMVGRTGKAVAPELYLALGISGSPHHVAGIQQSKKIVSVNVDPRAPIFDFSDAGFLGDLAVILPRLIERIRRYRDEGAA